MVCGILSDPEWHAKGGKLARVSANETTLSPTVSLLLFNVITRVHADETMPEETCAHVEARCTFFLRFKSLNQLYLSPN